MDMGKDIRHMQQMCDLLEFHARAGHVSSRYYERHAQLSLRPHSTYGSQNRGIARDPNTPIDVLVKLSTDQDPNVRIEVAKFAFSRPCGNEAFSETLVKTLVNMLSIDRDPSVRYHAAANPCIPVETLTELSASKDAYVRQGVAINPSTPVDILSTLSNDNDAYVRIHVSANSKTPYEVLLYLEALEAIYDVTDS